MLRPPFNVREHDPTYQEDLYFIEGQRELLTRQVRRVVLELGKSVEETAGVFGLTEDEVRELIQKG